MQLGSRLSAWAGPVVAAAAIAGLWFMSTGAAAIDHVPEMAGLRLEAAQQVASRAGYTTRVVLRAGPGLAGTVLDHDPAAGELLARGSPIELQVTQGARQVRVPDVRGLPVDDARRLLVEAGLTPGDVTYTRSTETEPNRVIATDPRAGASVDAGTKASISAAAP